MEVVRITLISRNRNQSTLIYARTITLLLLIIEVSHVSIRKTSITLRVPLCWRHRFRLRTAAKIQRNRKSQTELDIFFYFCGINLKSSNMTTITLSYSERNKTAQAVVKFLESLGVFKILKDDEPNATTIKAIEEAQ